MKKTLSLIIIPVIAIGSVIALIYYIKMDTFAFAWALNFMLMLFVSMFSGALKSPLTSSYYNQNTWERSGEIYRYLGIDFFRKLLVWIGWEKLIRKSSPIEKNTKALAHLHYQTKRSEIDHLIIFVIVMVFNVFVATRYGILKSLSLFILNVILNLYPILLQRYNRPRIERALNLSKRGREIFLSLPNGSGRTKKA